MNRNRTRRTSMAIPRDAGCRRFWRFSGMRFFRPRARIPAGPSGRAPLDGSVSPPSQLPRPVKVVVVGSGWHFLSGISYYTCRLSNALAGRFEVSTILMRRLLPAKLYPGRARVGRPLSTLTYASGIPVFDGVDWYGVPTLIRAIVFLRRCRPDVLILQWWTGTVLHSYLVL